MKRNWILGLLIPAILMPARCGGGGDDAGCDEGGDFSSRVVVRDHEGNTDDFVRDRPLELEYSFTNCRDRTIHLLYQRNPAASFAIDRLPKGETSGVWSDSGLIVDYGSNQDAVGPGETVTRTSKWVEAPSAEPGEYEASGWLADCHTKPGAGFECPRPATARFAINDE